MKNVGLIFSLILVVILQSCGTQKKRVKNNNSTMETYSSTKQFINEYNKEVSSFDQLKIKGDIDAKINGTKYNGGATLYFDNKKQIWINVTALLGINVARVNVTPEKAQGYEVVTRSYIDGDFTFFNEKLNVDFINFNRLQNLLLGQLFLIDDAKEYQLTYSEDNYVLEFKENERVKKNPKKGEYVHSFVLNENFDLVRVNIFDPESETTIKVDYNNWGVHNGKKFPGNVKVVSEGKKTTEIDLEYKKFDFEKMNPPFKIPNNYKKRTL